AVPSAVVERLAKPFPVRGVAGRAFGVAAFLAKWNEPREEVIEEEAEPDALAAALASDPIHAVIPIARAHQRESVRARRQRAIDRPAAVLVDGSVSAGRLGLQEYLILAVLQCACREVRSRLVQDRSVTGRADVERRHVRQ